MKKENGIYLLAFLVGVLIVNLFSSENWESSSMLNRYNLISLSFHGIVYEEYLVHVLLLRFKTVAGLWLLSKLLPEKIVMVSFSMGICILLGGVVAMAIMANGIWGLLFICCALFPHSICYGFAYGLWNNRKETRMIDERRTMQYLSTILILVLVSVGCILEAYISPIIIENVIKY